MMLKNLPFTLIIAATAIAGTAFSALEPEEKAADPYAIDDEHFTAEDVFQLELATDPQVHPSGRGIVYVRNSMDIMTDGRKRNLWMLDSEAGVTWPVTDGLTNASSPRWSPEGQRLAYVSSDGERSQIFVQWMGSQTIPITNLSEGPGDITWSPDGEWIAFTMRIPGKDGYAIDLPARPDGARWAEPAKYIDRLIWRRDGGGLVKPGYNHIFVIPANGGSPRQLTSGEYNHNGPLAWSPDGEHIIFSANKGEDWEYDPVESELWELNVQTRETKQLTDRDGPDYSPALSPDGETIAWLGNDDNLMGYQSSNLCVMNRDGSDRREIDTGLDGSIENIQWSFDGSGIFFTFDWQGQVFLYRTDLDGNIEEIANDLGGLGVGRPYISGTYDVADQADVIAWTTGTAYRLADIKVKAGATPAAQLTNLNEDLLGHKTLGEVEEIWYKSSFDDRDIQGWIVKPPDFDPEKKYPLILEIHGGPFSAYGPQFAPEVQLMATEGFVVLYTNPRGSTSYGDEFANLIHHNYPGEDYDDLISGVDEVISRGYIDPNCLFVTGGSGGGVLTSWIIGMTDRFRAAVVQKPVINWYSFVLTADAYNYFYKYWFPGYPWEYPEEYMRRSPLSLVGNVETPTMLITGEVDYRTPMSETEQYYQALKLRRIEAALVRIPEAGHGIASRPSYLVTKVAYIVKWFKDHMPKAEDDVEVTAE